MLKPAKKNAAAQISTANRLIDGAVVFLAAGGTWSTNVDASEVARDPDTIARLQATAAQAEKDRVVVGPYMLEVAADGGRVQPVQMRERIRAFGPTVEGPVPERVFAQ